MNRYEVAVVLSAELTDEQRLAEIQAIKDYIPKYTGTVTNVDEWGRKKLAYEIRKQSEGFYYFIKCEGQPELSVNLEKELRLRNETILRYLIVKDET